MKKVAAAVGDKVKGIGVKGIKTASASEFPRYSFDTHSFDYRCKVKGVGFCGVVMMISDLGVALGAGRQESGEEKAQRIIEAGMKGLGWDAEELQARAKGHKKKVKLARRLRKETTMSLNWIARELDMGSWTYVSNLVGQFK